MPELEIKDLRCVFADGTEALKGINVSFPQGQFAVICGANGCGKSVFAFHLNGLISPTKGLITFGGQDIQKNLRNARKNIGLVFQDPDSQIIGQTARKDAAFGPQNLGYKKNIVDEKTETALRTIGLWERRDERPHLFSGGEKRRLAIAGLLAMDSQVLVFDEPLSNLDYPGVRQALKSIIDLHSEGRTIILITHDLSKVLAHADRLIVMNGGKIAADGNPEDLLDKLEENGVRRPAAIAREQMSWLK